MRAPAEATKEVAAQPGARALQRGTNVRADAGPAATLRRRNRGDRADTGRLHACDEDAVPRAAGPAQPMRGAV